MDRNKLYSLLLLLWVVLAVGSCIYWLIGVGDRVNNSGPQALAADRQGGFYLATNREVLHFDANARLLARASAESLGLHNLMTAEVDAAGQLWLYDGKSRRPWRCDSQLGQCTAFGPETLGLAPSVALAFGPQQQLVIADNTNQRIVVLDAGGKLLDDGHGKTWHYPNQISRDQDSLLLADTERFGIFQLDPTQPNGPEKAVLKTQNRPYRFVRRGADWWVVEAGPSLTGGWLRHYYVKDGELSPAEAPPRIPLDYHDIIAIADTGSELVLASKSDWGLLGLDPVSGTIQELGSPELQAEFAVQREQHRQAVAEQKRLPGIMIALIVPALLLGVVLQKRMDAAKLAASPPPPPPRP